MYKLNLYETDEKRSFHTNIPVNSFTQKSENVSFIFLEPKYRSVNFNLAMLQVYPENNEKTFYDIKPDHSLYLFCKNSSKEFILKSVTSQNDNYLYFKADTTVEFIFIVQAKSKEEAESYLRK
jgi:hypothetical protein